MTLEADGVVAGVSERRSPGLAALFEALHADGRHSILDLGPASAAQLRVLRPFATQIRFADLLGDAGTGADWSVLRPNPERPYDVVLVWDCLDRLGAMERTALLARIAELSAERARLHAIAGSESRACSGGASFTLLARDLVREQPSPVTSTHREPLLPAEMARALAPFEVVSAFMLRTGAREYLAMKRA